MWTTRLVFSPHKCLFEGVTALKRIQMGDRDDDGALHSVACGFYVHLFMILCACLLACTFFFYAEHKCVCEGC